MKTLRNYFLALVVLAPFTVVAVPTIKVTAPAKSPTTNGVLNASGTAAGTVAIASVQYSLNGAAWTAVSGTTNWTVSGLQLVPGTNTFSAYAVDTGNGISKTNTVVFIYIVAVPIQLATNGVGTITPTKNGALLQLGKTYSISAKAAKGFAFTGWTGSITNPSTKLTFVMASNLSFTANFADAARPVCVVTFPSVKHSVSNSPITITGSANDNVGVMEVNVQVNGGGWKSASIISAQIAAPNPVSWSFANAALTSGANTVQAFAQDAAGNVSLTNSVTFNYVSNAPPPVAGPAPSSLSGMKAQVAINGGPSFQVTFSDATFSQDGGTVASSYVGNYSYTLLSSNTAELVMTGTSPAQKAGDGSDTTVTFTDNTDATFTDTNGNSGTVTLSAAANLAPDPSATLTLQWADLVNVTNTMSMSGGAFTDPDSIGNVNSGNYVIQSFGPATILISGTFTAGPLAGDTFAQQLDFTDADDGDLSVSVFNGNGGFIGQYTVPFVLLSKGSLPAGNAPATMAGTEFTVTASGKTFQLGLGASTYSQDSSSSANENRVGNYVYMRTGPNTAVFEDIQTLPPNNSGNSQNLVYFTFSKSTAFTFASTNVDNGQTNVETGSVTVKAAPNTAPAPALLSGKSISLSLGNVSGTVVLKSDGTFQLNSNSGTSDSGTYTCSQFSPICDMLVLSTIASNVGDVGKTDYAELTFSSSTAGSIFVNVLDNLGNLDNTLSGSFSIH